MGDTIFTDIFTTVIVTINYVRLVTRAFINYFKIQICHAIAGKHNLLSPNVFFFFLGGGGNSRAKEKEIKPDLRFSGNGKNE